MLSKLSVEDIAGVADLHSKVIPFSLNSQMGISRILELYSLVQNNEKFICLVSKDSSGRILSFISGTGDYKIAFKDITSRFKFPEIFRLLFRHNPIKTICSIVDSLQIHSILKNLGSEVYILTSWGSDPMVDSGKDSVLVFLEICKRANTLKYTHVSVDVRKSNLRLVDFYLRTGFVIQARTIFSLVLIKALVKN
jgi:hypothetical protein